MRYATLVSGGKDSVLAHHVAHQWGWEPVGVITIRPDDPHSFLFHTPNIDVVALQAEALGLPLLEQPSARDDEAERAALRAACEHARAAWRADTIVTGAVASEYQRVRVERAAHEAGIKSHHPLWHKSGDAILDTIAAGGFDVRVAAAAADGLDETWLGRPLDGEAIAELHAVHGRTRIHVAGEGGEYETLVLDAPLFDAPIVVDDAQASWDGHAGRWRVTGAHLAAE